MSLKNKSGEVPVLKCGAGRAKQEDREACDMNTIFARYMRTGVWDQTARVAPVFADVSSVPDFRAAVELVQAVQGAFRNLPAAVRRAFGEDPASLVEFLADPRNREEAIRLGLLQKPSPKGEAEKVDKVPPVVKKEEGGGGSAPAVA